MKIQSFLILSAVVGTATAADKRKRVFKIYTQDEIRAERTGGSAHLRGSSDEVNHDPFIGLRRELEGASMSMGNFIPAEMSMSMGLTPAEMSMSLGLTPAEMSMSMGLTPAEMSMSMGLTPAEMSMSMGLTPAEMSISMPTDLKKTGKPCSSDNECRSGCCRNVNDPSHDSEKVCNKVSSEKGEICPGS